ncbi:MAG: cellobiose phosphorylase [Bacilli bacterium]|nr:cellobiose phosphorylase [Bacilli bacterium]
MIVDSDYRFENGKFIIEKYNRAKTFSSFLPGIAGEKGIPLWAFYVNRAQGIAGFGLQDKNHPVMIYRPANKAYETVSTSGFRTFIKISDKIYEPFTINSDNDHVMIVDQHKFEIEETNTTVGLKVKITYFGLPNEKIAALVRKVEVTNLNDKPLAFEMLDGLAELIPAGVRTDEFNSVSNLLQSWMEVKCLDQGFGFYSLRGSTADSSVVSEVSEGNFYIGFDENGLTAPISDKDVIFDHDSSKSFPWGFQRKAMADLIGSVQANVNKVPCAFAPYEKNLAPHAKATMVSFLGHTDSLKSLMDLLEKITNFAYVEKKEQEAYELITRMTDDVATSTAYPEFDAYVRQNYLDNSLRGGYPISVGNKVYHLYARRHGDLERDYNFFSLAPEYYSTGPGNFRDVCQNRRLDSVIHPEVGDFNIRQFANLIQLDGYNPLAINGVSYHLNQTEAEVVVKSHFQNKHDEILTYLKKDFRLSSLMRFLESIGAQYKRSEQEAVEALMQKTDAIMEANFGEGYWIDHFTYLLDLVEKYEMIYPDKMQELMFDKDDFLYFDSPIRIRSKNEKCVLLESGIVRQYNSIDHYDKEKVERLGINPKATNYAHIKGETYKSNLYVKLLILALNKFAQLDPEGFGVEMEAEKPGWNDAMNGLPGLFGSGVSEAIELKRIIDFLLRFQTGQKVKLPVEVVKLHDALKNDRSYFSRVKAREEYRENIRFGLCGQEAVVSVDEISPVLKDFSDIIYERLETLYSEYEGIVPTYLTYDVEDYVEIKENGNQVLGFGNRPLVKPLTFSKKAVAPFLEAPARLLKTEFPNQKLKAMAEKIKQTEMFDPLLKQYKTSVSLESESSEIGRIRAFTPGWLERESNFLHMSYKYLLGLLKARLYPEFYEALKTNFVCFMDPKIYGRNIIENSSFIAPSNNPDSAVHGQGFYARLSGSTIEALDIWLNMMTGDKVFEIIEGQLAFQPKPIIPGTYFNKDGTVSFRLFGKTDIVYHNLERLDTFSDLSIYKYELVDHDNKITTVLKSFVEGDLAYRIRDNGFQKIHIHFIKKQ